MQKKKQSWWHQPHVTLIETKKSINHKPNIKIKVWSHHWISDNKTSKQDPTWLYFEFFNLYFLIIVIYSVVARTKWMKCENKRELSEQIYMSSRKTNVVSEQIRIRVGYMLLL
jgi:hypothetical protein